MTRVTHVRFGGKMAAVQSHTIQAAILSLLLGWSGCATTISSAAVARGGHYFLCCNLFFNRSNDATDANYLYAYPSEGTKVSLGTRVEVLRVGAHSVRFSSLENGGEYELELHFALKQVAPTTYFERIFLATDPRAALSTLPPVIEEAIRGARLIVGMTRDQALMARGFPPMHQTKGLDAPEWIYFQRGSFIDRVKFDDGRITSIETDVAP